MSEYTNPPTKILISVLLGVAIIGGFVFVIQDMNQYNAVLDTSPLYTNISQHETYIRNQATILSDKTEESNAISPGLSLIGLVWNGLQSMWTTVKATISVIPSIGRAISEEIGIPMWFLATITSIISIITIAAIIKVITGREL